MNKTLLTLTLLASTGHLVAKNVWLLNLTDYDQGIPFRTSVTDPAFAAINLFTTKGVSFHTIKAGAHSKSDGWALKGRFFSLDGDCDGDWHHDDWTIIMRKNGRTQCHRGSIYQLKAVKDAIKDDLNCNDPKNCIKNW